MMTREKIGLDGTWRIALDPKNIGKKKKWFRDGFEGEAYDIQVPSCWEERFPFYDGVAWYWRDFDVKKEWADKQLRIRFWAVNYFAEVWVNGQYAGSHEGGYTPFEVDITELVRYGGANTIYVRVINPPKRGAISKAVFSGYVAGETTEELTQKGVDGFILDEIPNWKQQFYYNFGGIWQPVEMIVSNKIWTKDCFIKPLLKDAAIDLEHLVQNDSGSGCEIEVTYQVVSCRSPDVVVAERKEGVPLSAGQNRLEARLPIPNPNLWSPENPHLYLLKIVVTRVCPPAQGTAEDEGITDEWSQRFGMREFTVQDNFFYLNGQKIILKSALHQGIYGRTIAYPETAELARREIALAKEAGLNMLRIHVKPAPKRFIELADEMGLMLHEEPPIGWMKDNPKLREREEREVREMVLRDRNNPSVVMWGILNETSNLGGVQIAGSVAIMHDLCLIARQLDPTRIILDDSGGYGNGTNAYMPYSNEPVGVRDMHRYVPAPITEFDYRSFNKLGQPDQLSFMSEFGSSGLEDFGLVLSCFDRDGDSKLEDYIEMKGFYDYLDAGLQAHGLNDIFPDVSSFCQAAQRCQAEADRLQIEAMRANPNMAGWCLTQFNDASSEVGAGMLDIWRNPKAVFDVLKEVTKPLYVVVHVNPRTVYVNAKTRIDLTLVNEDVLSGPAELCLQVTTPSGRVVCEQKEAIIAEAWVQPMPSVTVNIPGEEGYYQATATLTADGKTLTQTSHTFFGQNPAAHCPTGKFMVLDPENNLRAWLAKMRLHWTDFKVIDGPNTATVLVANMKHPSGYYDIYDELRQLSHVVLNGATAIFLEGNFNELMYLFLRFVVGHTDGRGGLGGNFHYIKPHPVFDGLPSGCLMDWEYANIWARETMKETCVANLNPETIVGIVAAGSDPSTWYSDMLITRQGKGWVLLSKLHLGENLGKDPVADRIVLNMLRWAMEKR